VLEDPVSFQCEVVRMNRGVNPRSFVVENLFEELKAKVGN